MRVLLVLALLASCDHSSEGGPSSGSGSGSAKRTGSAGGFSASLAADLAKIDAGVTVAAPPKDGAVSMGSSVAVGPMLGSAQGSQGPMTAPPPAHDAGSSGAPKVHEVVKTSADLAAIKLILLPNWVRDLDEPGTYTLVVHVQGKADEVLFTFHYGYDEPKVPDDHDAYMKYLADNKILGGTGPGGIVGLNRQRGAAWYLEGVDGAGSPAFRYLVMYGGKHLICHGSLYKESNLGDLRDEVIIQAKKICESITL